MQNLTLMLFALFSIQFCKKRTPQLPKIISSDSYKISDDSKAKLSKIKSKKDTIIGRNKNFSPTKDNDNFGFYTNISKDSVFINYQTIDSIKVVKVKFPKYNIETVLYLDENIKAYKNNRIYWKEKATSSEGVLTISNGTWFDLTQSSKP